jgi:hypothetical protein
MSLRLDEFPTDTWSLGASSVPCNTVLRPIGEQIFVFAKRWTAKARTQIYNVAQIHESGVSLPTARIGYHAVWTQKYAMGCMQGPLPVYPLSLMKMYDPQKRCAIPFCQHQSPRALDQPNLPPPRHKLSPNSNSIAVGIQMRCHNVLILYYKRRSMALENMFWQKKSHYNCLLLADFSA